MLKGLRDGNNGDKETDGMKAFVGLVEEIFGTGSGEVEGG
jgi:hypothetical protein